MKRILFVIISLMICVCGYSQKHMKFQGIEIDGTVKSFVDKLVQKGYKYEISLDNNGAALSGTFTNKKAFLGVYANSNSVVYCVLVYLSDCKEWKSLLNEYNYYKDLYTKKYGEPVSVTETYDFISNNNYVNILQLVNGKIEWKCWFETEDGEILLSIRGKDNKLEEDSGCISIMYRDKSNFEKSKSRDIEDI